jgi:ABC-2 type transport system permease protein
VTGSPATWLIMRREISERVRSRLAWILTLVAAAGVVALIVVPARVQRASGPTKVGLVGSASQQLAAPLGRIAAASHVRIRIVDVPTDPAARSRVTSGDLDVALEITGETATATVDSSMPASLEAVVRSVLASSHLVTTLTEASVPQRTIRRALTPPALHVVALSPGTRDRAARSAAALAAAVLLYLSLNLYGAAVASGVAQEKTSRTAEVLLAAVRPTQLLTGKVVGIGLFGLAQLAIIVAAGLAANALASGVRIPGTVWVLLPTVLLWFLLGFALYSFALAAGGAMVARQEEVQMATLPVSLPILAGLLLTYAMIARPTAWWIRLLSLLPPLSPVLMPARVALGHVAWWEFGLAVALTVATTVFVARTASRIYTHAIVRGGARMSWRTALRRRSAR